MRITRFAMLSASLALTLACARVLAATTAPAPTAAQVSAAIQQAEAEHLKQLEQTDPAAAERARSPFAMALVASIKANTVKGCLPARGGEIVCIVGVQAGRREGYRALAFRDNPEPWVLARRETPSLDGPDAGQATAAMREFARAELKANPSGEYAVELTEMAKSLVVKQLDECDLSRDSGNVNCAATASVGGQPDKHIVGLAFALETDGWRFVPRASPQSD